MDKTAKLILNSMRCPLCKAQIDIIEPRPNPSYESWSSNFGCVADPEHYGIWFVHWEGPPPRIVREMIVVNEGDHQYKVVQIVEQFTSSTTIKIYDIDAEQRVIYGRGHEVRTFQFNKHLFKFSNTNREKILNRIKTILVFQ